MENETLISLIEAEWDLENGFFGKLRQGEFDHECHSRCKRTLERIEREMRNADSIPRRLISLVWYIPLFMTWQTERVQAETNVGLQEYQGAANEILTIVQQILGVP